MKRPRLLLLALAAAALAALAGVQRAASVAGVEGARPPSAPPRPAPSAPSPESLQLQYGAAFIRQPLPHADDPFRPRSWAPLSAPAPSGPPPRPVAPPLPFTFSGVMEDEQGRTLFVRRGDAVLAARANEALDGSYRVEEIGNDSAVLTYVPLAERQTLPYPK